MKDYSIKGVVTYPLDEILFLVLCGCVCGFEDFDEIVMWGKANINWISKFLPYKNKIPIAKNIRKVINHLDPNHFEESFERWVTSMSVEII
ncbi:MAG: transposase family protein [Rickettsiaceae bacterium]|nr:transposase family protein [Rickettsiaceae bacterium]